MEAYIMTDKQYEGMLKDSIASLDRIAKSITDKTDILHLSQLPFESSSTWTHSVLLLHPEKSREMQIKKQIKNFFIR